MVNLVLTGECTDEVLQGLYVAEVQLAPDATRLLVIVGSAVPGETLDQVDVLTRLHRHSGQLRAEVASSIRLRFQVASESIPVFCP